MKKIDEYGNVRYYNENNQLHRTDGPACEYPDGFKAWWVNGKLHRTDGPAVKYANGDKTWFVNNKLHRTDGPAVEYANGDKAWFVNGEKLSELEITNNDFSEGF